MTSLNTRGREIATYKGRQIIKRKDMYIIIPFSRNSRYLAFTSLVAATTALDKDRRIKVVQ